MLFELYINHKTNFEHIVKVTRNLLNVYKLNILNITIFMYNVISDTAQVSFQGIFNLRRGVTRTPANLRNKTETFAMK